MLMYRLPFLKALFSSAHNSLATSILLPNPLYFEVQIAYNLSFVSYKGHILVLTIQFVDPYGFWMMFSIWQHWNVHSFTACPDTCLQSSNVTFWSYKDETHVHVPKIIGQIISILEYWQETLPPIAHISNMHAQPYNSIKPLEALCPKEFVQS